MHDSQASHFFFVLQLLRIQSGKGKVYTHSYYRRVVTGSIQITGDGCHT